MCHISDYIYDKKNLGKNIGFLYNLSKIYEAMILDDRFMKNAQKKLSALQFTRLQNLKHNITNDADQQVSNAMTLIELESLLKKDSSLITNQALWKETGKVLIPMNNAEYKLSRNILAFYDKQMGDELKKLQKKYENDTQNPNYLNDYNDIRDTSIVAVSTHFNVKTHEFTFVALFYSGFALEDEVKSFKDFLSMYQSH